MGRRSKFSAEVRERAVRLVFDQLGHHESEWAAISAIAGKMGCTAETLRKWVRQAQRDSGKRDGLTTTERDRLKDLTRPAARTRRSSPPVPRGTRSFVGRSGGSGMRTSRCMEPSKSGGSFAARRSSRRGAPWSV